MLISFGLTALTACGFVALVLFKKFRYGAYLAICYVGWIFFYTIILLGTSFLSSETTLGLKKTKSYCGFYLDCHMKTAVSNVDRTREYKGVTANGEYYVVGVEVSSDARRAKLRLLSPKFEVVDANGRRFDPNTVLSTPLLTFENPIGPDETIKGTLVFDLPRNIDNPRLDIRMNDSIDNVFESVLVGDEDSLYHSRTYFALVTNSRKF